MKQIMLMLCMLVVAFAENTKDAVYVSVNGLVCDFCAISLEKVFGKQQAVQSIKVDLNKKIITIYFKHGESIDDAKIVKLIEDSGYNVREIKHAQ